MSAEGTLDRNHPACYTIDMKMTQESLYHMVSVEKQLNPSAPLRVWTTFGFLLCLCFICFLAALIMCVVKVSMGEYRIRGSLMAASVFLSLTFFIRTLGPRFIRSGLFNSDRSNRMQLDTAWRRFLIKNGEPRTVTYEFYRNYFSTSGGRGTLEYSQISRICETNQCLVLYTRDHGGYLLDKKQIGAACLSGLRTLLTERSGKTVKWVQVREFTPEKNN